MKNFAKILAYLAGMLLGLALLPEMHTLIRVFSVAFGVMFYFLNMVILDNLPEEEKQLYDHLIIK